MRIYVNKNIRLYAQLMYPMTSSAIAKLRTQKKVWINIISTFFKKANVVQKAERQFWIKDITKL